MAQRGGKAILVKPLEDRPEMIPSNLRLSPDQKSYPSVPGLAPERHRQARSHRYVTPRGIGRHVRGGI